MKIRDDIKTSTRYYMKLNYRNNDLYVSDMLSPGETVTIEKVIETDIGFYHYKLKEDKIYNYTDEMFDPALIDFLYEEYLMNN